jgi:hypothetical protein
VAGLEVTATRSEPWPPNTVTLQILKRPGPGEVSGRDGWLQPSRAAKSSSPTSQSIESADALSCLASAESFCRENSRFRLLPGMMGQRQRDAVAEFPRWHAVIRSEQDGTFALVLERVGIEFAELPDQAALTMKVDGITIACLQTIDAHRRAAAGFFGEIARLAPFQGFGEATDAVVLSAVSNTSSRNAMSFARMPSGYDLKTDATLVSEIRLIVARLSCHRTGDRPFVFAGSADLQVR